MTQQAKESIRFARTLTYVLPFGLGIGLFAGANFTPWCLVAYFGLGILYYGMGYGWQLKTLFVQLVYGFIWIVEPIIGLTLYLLGEQDARNMGFLPWVRQVVHAA